MSKKVGIFSGSFNPIHNGHIAIARYMVEKEKFDEIWFIVSPKNPLKSQIGLLDDEIRADMTKLAIHIQNYACSSDRIIGKFSTVGNLMMRSLKIIRYIYTRARDFRSKQRYSLLPYTLHTHPWWKFLLRKYGTLSQPVNQQKNIFPFRYTITS